MSAHLATSQVWWPQTDASEPSSGVVAVSVNYNTRDLIALLVWSLYRFAGEVLRSVVVVDNGSSDGSIELLRALASADVCRLIANTENRHHGPALSQAVSSLAATHPSSGLDTPWIWLLDSDCIVAGTDGAQQAVTAATRSSAAVVGESRWDPWNDEMRFNGCSLLIDPSRAWRPEVGFFEGGGDPVGEFEQSCRRNGVPAQHFPFTQDGHVIHLGRASLAGILERGETSNPHFDWACDHHEPHFQKVPGADTRYAAIAGEFNDQVPGLDPAALIRSCLSRRRRG